MVCLSTRLQEKPRCLFLTRTIIFRKGVMVLQLSINFQMNGVIGTMTVRTRRLSQSCSQKESRRIRMEVKVELDRDIIFLKLSGGLVASTLEQLRNQIQKLVDKKYVNIVFDMSRVDFVDSSGLGLCISTARELAAISGKLVCCGLSDNVQKLFKMTRADQKVAVMASRMNAFEYMLSRLNDDPHGASVLHE